MKKWREKPWGGGSGTRGRDGREGGVWQVRRAEVMGGRKIGQGGVLLHALRGDRRQSRQWFIKSVIQLSHVYDTGEHQATGTGLHKGRRYEWRKED